MDEGILGTRSRLTDGSVVTAAAGGAGVSIGVSEVEPCSCVAELAADVGLESEQGGEGAPKGLSGTEILWLLRCGLALGARKGGCSEERQCGGGTSRRCCAMCAR